MFKDFFDNLFPFLKLFLYFFGVLALIAIIVACFVFCDMSNLETIRYCPSCGIDLIYRT